MPQRSSARGPTHRDVQRQCGRSQPGAAWQGAYEDDRAQRALCDPGRRHQQNPGRTWDDVKERCADYLLDMVTDLFQPNLKDVILERVVRSPLDLERTMPSAVRSSVTHGAFLPYRWVQ